MSDRDSDFELRELERRWRDGQSALPVVELLVSRGAEHEAAAVARLAQSEAGCADAAALETILSRLTDSPEGWGHVLSEFAESPSLERWRNLMRFVPAERIYDRQRDSIRELRALGVDSNLLFLCACEFGMTPDAISLVEEGGVSVDTILQRASLSGAAKTTYLGLAAEAAFLARDMLGAVRLLREAIANENEWCSALPHAVFIRDRASAQERELDRAGIPVL